MNPSSTLFVIAAVAVVAALLYTCPSSGNCPLVQWFGRSGGGSTAPPTEPAGEQASVDDPVAETPKPVTASDSAEGEESMRPVETKPRYGEVLHADAESFDQLVLQSKVPVLVDFYADWCRPCQMLAPILEELARERPDVKIVKVDVEANPTLASQFRINSIPALIAFRDGNIVDNHLGLADRGTLERMLEN